MKPVSAVVPRTIVAQLGVLARSPTSAGRSGGGGFEADNLLVGRLPASDIGQGRGGLAADHEILVGRQGDRRQYGHYGHHDHHFDQGEAPLRCLHFAASLQRRALRRIWIWIDLRGGRDERISTHRAATAGQC